MPLADAADALSVTALSAIGAVCARGGAGTLPKHGTGRSRERIAAHGLVALRRITLPHDRKPVEQWHYVNHPAPVNYCSSRHSDQREESRREALDGAAVASLARVPPTFPFHPDARPPGAFNLHCTRTAGRPRGAFGMTARFNKQAKQGAR